MGWENIGRDVLGIHRCFMDVDVDVQDRYRIAVDDFENAHTDRQKDVTHFISAAFNAENHPSFRKYVQALYEEPRRKAT